MHSMKPASPVSRLSSQEVKKTITTELNLLLDTLDSNEACGKVLSASVTNSLRGQINSLETRLSSVTGLDGAKSLLKDIKLRFLGAQSGANDNDVVSVIVASHTKDSSRPAADLDLLNRLLILHEPPESAPSSAQNTSVREEFRAAVINSIQHQTSSPATATSAPKVQGGTNDCWFVSVMTVLAESPFGTLVTNAVIPEDAPQKDEKNALKDGLCAVMTAMKSDDSGVVDGRALHANIERLFGLEHGSQHDMSEILKTLLEKLHISGDSDPFITLACAQDMSVLDLGADGQRLFTDAPPVITLATPSFPVYNALSPINRREVNQLTQLIATQLQSGQGIVSEETKASVQTLIRTLREESRMASGKIKEALDGYIQRLRTLHNKLTENNREDTQMALIKIETYQDQLVRPSLLGRDGSTLDPAEEQFNINGTPYKVDCVFNRAGDTAAVGHWSKGLRADSDLVYVLTRVDS